MADPARSDTVTRTPNASGTFDASVVAGDFNGDGRTDLALAGATTWRNVPVAFSNGDGSFELKAELEAGEDMARFALQASDPAAQILSGDFDGDGRTDLALAGASSWDGVPVALSQGDGSFTVREAESRDFVSWASASGVTPMTGDFNNDGRADVVLIPGPRSDWTGLPVALSNGDGTFEVRNERLEEFTGPAQVPGAKVFTGDFNKDGRTDLVLVPGPKAEPAGLPVALSNGDGTFKVASDRLEEFPQLAQAPGAKVTTGDFNSDGRTDLALTGGKGWTTVPLALADGNGGFEMRNNPAGEFAALAQARDVKVTAGDFNSDGGTDLVLTGGEGWDSLPLALAGRDGAFEMTSERLEDFPARAREPGAIVVKGDFDANGATDMLLTGVKGWEKIPTAFSDGKAHFNLKDIIAVDLSNLVVAPFASVKAPGIFKPMASAHMVTVRWYDRSYNERGFRVYKRTTAGTWALIKEVPTRNVLGSGIAEEYSLVDSRTDVSGQCYMVTAYNDDTGSPGSSEQCTVRPDAAAFPQTAPEDAREWWGLSSTNDGTGPLHNYTEGDDIHYESRSHGPDLGWNPTSLWRVEAQGGPQLMDGQAVALKVWVPSAEIGGWLRHSGSQLGIDLELTTTPSYEWRVIGKLGSGASSVGQPLGDSSAFALWNTEVQDYLVYGYEVWGINLDWYKSVHPPAETSPPPPAPTGVKSVKVVNCTWPQHHTLNIWVKDLTTGTPWVQAGSQSPNWTNYGACGPTTYSGMPFKWTVPTSGHWYELVALDTDPSYCFIVEPDPNVAFNCVRMDSLPFYGSTSSTVEPTISVD